MGRAAARRGAAALGALLVTASAALAQAPERYVHPQDTFALSIPEGVRVVEREGAFTLSIQSRKGWLINLQTGAVNSALGLAQMAEKLEGRYLGKGKTWTRKLGERTITVGRLPAYDALYEGLRTRARVVIARGAKTDFVFMFFAPPRTFDGLVTEFDWVLGSFMPAPGELTRAPAKAPTVAPAKAAPKASANRFGDRETGYTIEYPADWVAAKSSPFTVLFTGKQGTPAYFVTVSIQTVRPVGSGSGKGGVAAIILAELKSQMEQGATDLDYFGEAAFVYERDGLRLDGYEMLLTYSRQERRFRQWTVVLPRPAGDTADIWSYTAPLGHFDAFRDPAQAMLRSLRIEASTP